LKVRIKDIARLAQVSPGTVDRVIHNRGEVSPKTREKVQRIIKELNYQPDIVARALASKKIYRFAVLMPVSVNENDFWSIPRLGIEKAMNEVAAFGVEIKSYYFEQFNTATFLEQSEELLTEKPDAILFAPVFPKESIEFIERSRKLGITIMLFNSNLEKAEEMLFIGQDAQQSGYLAAKLLNYGLKSDGDILIINIAGRKDNHNHILRRERGFRKYYVDHPDIKANIVTIDCVQEQGKNFTSQLNQALSRYRIKAAFVTNSRVFEVANYFERKKIRSISLLGYDLLPQNVEALKRGSIEFLISQKPEQQGYLGVMTLFGKIVLKKDVQQVQYIPIDILTKENIDFYEYK
jgi:LacI family transcriptional regulator